MKKKGKIFIISGPSGSGKTTLYRKLLQSSKLKDKIVKTVSVTTRHPREGEVNGKDYFFVSQKMFLYKKKAGHFLENEKVFDRYYGTPRGAVTGLLRAGKNVLLCIDVKGAKTVRRNFPEAITIFIKTKNVKELKARLLKRGSEDEHRVSLRLRTAKKELREVDNYKYCVINDTLIHAQAQLERIVLSELEK